MVNVKMPFGNLEKKNVICRNISANKIKLIVIVNGPMVLPVESGYLVAGPLIFHFVNRNKKKKMSKNIDVRCFSIFYKH